MKFYTQNHKHYCGIDLHARCLYVCILDQHGKPLVHMNIKASPVALMKVIALYMKAIHDGKAKNDKIDSHKIAALMRGGMFPQAYVYPREMRGTRDLMRRRIHLMRKRSELLAHVQNTNSQYNLPDIGPAPSPSSELTGWSL